MNMPLTRTRAANTRTSTPRGNGRNQCHTEDPSNIGMAVPHRISSCPLFISLEPATTRWKLESESELEEGEVLIAITLPDLLYLQEQIKLATGVWCLAINLMSSFHP